MVSELVFGFSIIFISISVLAVIAELTKQPLIVAFIAAGMIIGPPGLGLISDWNFFRAIGEVGIILLLFLVGLELDPRDFAFQSLKYLPLTLIASAVNFTLAFLIGWYFQLGLTPSLFLAAAFMFSSTVVVLKIIKDTWGVPEEVRSACISILIIQDLLAVLALLVLSSYVEVGGFQLTSLVRFVLAGASLLVVALVLERYLVGKVFHRHKNRMDVLILLGLAWCFLFAEIAEYLRFSREIGAFIAGLAITYFPRSKYKAFLQRSETIRDFFIILFFFVLGASVEWHVFLDYWPLITLMVLLAVVVKPIIYYYTLRLDHLKKQYQHEVALRLGQLSEFSVILLLAGASSGQVGQDFLVVVEVIMFLSIILSNYLVLYYPHERPNLGKVS